MALFLGMTALVSSANAAPRFALEQVEYAGAISDSSAISDGYFVFCADDYTMGYIDSNGKTAIQPVFTYAGSFADGLAPAAVRNGKIGYIDKTGKYAIKPQFDFAESFADGLALACRGDKTGYIDKTGRFVKLNLDADLTAVSSFSDGVAWVRDKDGRYGLIDKTGKLLIECKYLWITPFSDGVSWVSTDMGDDFSHIRMGLIDKKGNYLIEPGIYTDAQSFSEGLAWARKAGEDGIFLIDKEGSELARLEDGWMPSKFSGGISVAVIKDALRVIDRNGSIIWSSSKYRPAYYGGFQEGCVLVTDKYSGRHYILRDTEYTFTEPPDKTDYVYEYMPDEPKQKNYEIALKIGSNTAIVDGIKKQIDEGNANVKAHILGGRTMLPLRFIVENMPCWSVGWDYMEGCALLTNEDTAISVCEGDTRVRVMRYIPEERWYRQEQVILDQPPVTIEDRLFLPVRAIGEIMGGSIFWDSRGLVVVSNELKELTYDKATQLLAQFE